MANPLSVLMVTSEAHPFAKTGGLAEVSASLTDALGHLGHTVTLVLPRYRGVTTEGAERLETRLRFGDRLQAVTFLARPLSDRITLVLVDVPEFFDREGVYGTADGDYPDNALRYAVFSRAALEYPRLRAHRPSIIHAHDWQTGLVPVYQKMQLSRDPFVGGVPAVFTLHNLAFQGIFPAATLPAIDHDRQPGLRARDRRARARIRVRGHPRAPLRRSRRHPQRHRHRALDADIRRIRARVVRRRRSGRQARREARAPDDCRAPGRRRRHGQADRRAGVAPD
jgi:hypothetical protein